MDSIVSFSLLSCDVIQSGYFIKRKVRYLNIKENMVFTFRWFIFENLDSHFDNNFLIFILFFRKDPSMQILEFMEFPRVDFGVPFCSCGWTRNIFSIEG